MDTEQQVIEIIQKHYQTCVGKPAPLQALKKHYGQGFKFKSLGLGNYGEFMQRNAHHFQVESSANKLVTEMDRKMISEEDLLATVNSYFEQSEMFYHRRHVLQHIKKIYGSGDFASFGYGTFREFQEKHGLDMGIARQQDFRSLKEWYNWTGRRG